MRVTARSSCEAQSDQTEFEFIKALAIEYFVFGSVYVWILPDVDSRAISLRIGY